MENGEKKYRKSFENKNAFSIEPTLISLNLDQDEFKNERLLKLEAESTLSQLWTRTPEKNEMLIRQKQAIRSGENSSDHLQIDKNPEENTALSLDAALTHTITDMFNDDFEISMQIPEPPQKNFPLRKTDLSFAKLNCNIRNSNYQNEIPQKSFNLKYSIHQINKEIPIKPPKPLSIHKRVPPIKETCIEDAFFHPKEEQLKNVAAMSREHKRPADDSADTCPEHVRPLIVVLWCAVYCLTSALQHFYYHYL